jgi:hypothetical protein
VLSNDAANVFITLSARSLNPGLEIIARGEVPSTESKLLQAGANKVVLPTHIGAERIAEMILYQETARFIRGSDRMKDFEKVLQSLGLDIDVVVAAPKSPVIGMTIEAIGSTRMGPFSSCRSTGAGARRLRGRMDRWWLGRATGWCWWGVARRRGRWQVCSRRGAERISGFRRGRGLGMGAGRAERCGVCAGANSHFSHGLIVSLSF